MKYAVISISDKRFESVAKIHDAMRNHEYVSDIEFVDGRIGNPFDILNHIGIRLDTYKPDDGRQYPMTATEAGCWISHIRCIDAVIERGYESLLVFEDDAGIDDSFAAELDLLVGGLPKDYDFLSLYGDDIQNVFSESSDIGSAYIHKCISQLSYNVAMLYSQKGARKISRLARRFGATYNVDSIIYRGSRDGMLNGYIVRPDLPPLVRHGEYQSIIDPTNDRMT